MRHQDIRQGWIRIDYLVTITFELLLLPNALTLAQSMSQTPPLRDRCHTSLFADVLYALLAFTSREGRHCTGKREALWSRALRNDLMFGDNYADFKFVIRGAQLARHVRDTPCSTRAYAFCSSGA